MMMSKKEAWGIFRPDKNGQWKLLNDKAHQSFGISSVSQEYDYVQINYEIPFKMIHWTAVTPDEKMIFHNIQVGATARLSCARVYFAKMGIPLDPKMLQLGKKSNFWFYISGE
jgi:hypothetical protein